MTRARALLLARSVAFFLFLVSPFLFLFATVLFWSGRTWILPFGAAWWGWAAGAAVAYDALVSLGSGVSSMSVKSAAGIAFLALMFGATAGPFALRLANCLGDTSPAEESTLERVDYSYRGRVRVRLASPFPGAEFDVLSGAWSRLPAPRFFVHHGRLGVPWGEVR